MTTVTSIRAVGDCCAALQVPLYAVNQHLVVDKLKALDVGGSITIHAFGAYYGLAASMVLSITGSGVEHHKNGASYTSDMTAMIGTIFLWLFWVSMTPLSPPPSLVRCCQSRDGGWSITRTERRTPLT